VSFTAILTACIGGSSIFTVIATSFLNRNQRKTDVAKSLTEASDKFLDRADKEIEKLTLTNQALVLVAIDLLEIVEEVLDLPLLENMDQVKVEIWQKRARAARIGLALRSITSEEKD
jgi:hypothetical protein